MSKFLGEDSPERQIGRHGFRIGQGERRPTAPSASYEIKIAADDSTFDPTDEPFVFAIPRGLNRTQLISAEAFVSTVGSSQTEVSINNLTLAVAMLSTNITIDSGDYTSYVAANESVVAAPPDALVHTGNRIQVQIENAGSGAMGLGVILEFG